MKRNIFTSLIFFSARNFFHGHWQLTGQQEKGGEILLFHSTTFTRSRTFRHSFATLHVRWLSHIFNRNACIYQTATRWYLPPYRITFWLIDAVVLIFVCLLVDLILGFVTAISHEKPVDRIDYYPCITSEPTKVCLSPFYFTFAQLLLVVSDNFQQRKMQIFLSLYVCNQCNVNTTCCFFMLFKIISLDHTVSWRRSMFVSKI